MGTINVWGRPPRDVSKSSLERCEKDKFKAQMKRKTSSCVGSVEYV